MTSHVSKGLHWYPPRLSDAGTPRKHPESERLAEDNQERNPITIKPKTVSHMAQQSSWVPSASCPPPEGSPSQSSLLLGQHRCLLGQFISKCYTRAPSQALEGLPLPVKGWHPVSDRNQKGKDYGRGVWWRMDTCVCVTETLHCSAETIPTFWIGCTPMQNTKVKKCKDLKLHYSKTSWVFPQQVVTWAWRLEPCLCILFSCDSSTWCYLSAESVSTELAPVCGHTTLNTPHLVWSQKLSRVGPG